MGRHHFQLTQVSGRAQGPEELWEWLRGPGLRSRFRVFQKLRPLGGSTATPSPAASAIGVSPAGGAVRHCTCR